MSAVTNGHSAAISIVTWFLLVTSFITTVTRICIRWSSSMKFHKDDLCSLVSLSANIGAGIAISIAVNHGLGTPVTALSSDNVRIVQKSLYSNDLLFILVELFSRLSVVFLMQRIFINKSHKPPTLILGALVVLQGFTFFIAAAFPCDLPNAWAIGSGTAQCVDLYAFWLIYGVFDIVLDLALVAIPCLMATTVQITLANKLIVGGCFSLRICVVGASATQLAFVHAFASADPTGDLWTWYFIGQVVQTLTIISSCIPYLGQFMKAFPSGMLQFQSDETKRRTTTTAHSSRTNTVRTNATQDSYVLKDVKDRTPAVPKKGEIPVRDSQEEWLQKDVRTSVRSVTVSPVEEMGRLSRQGRGSVATGVVRSIDFETSMEHVKPQFG